MPSVQQLRTRVAVLETEVRDQQQLLQRQEQLQQAAQQSKVSGRAACHSYLVYLTEKMLPMRSLAECTGVSAWAILVIG